MGRLAAVNILEHVLCSLDLNCEVLEAELRPFIGVPFHQDFWPVDCYHWRFFVRHMGHSWHVACDGQYVLVMIRGMVELTLLELPKPYECPDGGD